MNGAPPQVYLVRNGETAWTISRQHTGRTDIPVPERGEREAQALSARLRGMSFTKVLTSPAATGAAEASSYPVVSWSLGIFLTISFILFGLVVPPRLHGMSVFLEAVLPAFKWLTLGGFVLGVIESFHYGVYIGIVFVPIYNFINKKWGA